MLKLIKKYKIVPQDILDMFIMNKPFLSSDQSGQSYSAFEEYMGNWTITTDANWAQGQLEGTYEYCQNEYDGNALVYSSPIEIKKWKIDLGVEPIVVYPKFWSIEKLIAYKQNSN